MIGFYYHTLITLMIHFHLLHSSLNDAWLSLFTIQGINSELWTPWDSTELSTVHCCGNTFSTVHCSGNVFSEAVA
jgi:hypothetical protein